MSKKFIFLVALVVLLVSSVSVTFAAQGTLPIEYGDELSGRIVNPEKGILYSFEGSEGDEIVLQATSEDIDVYVRLGDVDGNIVAENDDVSKGNTNAEIDFTLEADGTYFFAVLGYDAGDYTVALDAASSGGEGGNVGDIIPLEYNDIVVGEAISMDEGIVYSFDGQEGDEVTVVAVSEETDTYLLVVDDEGNIIAENDDMEKGVTDAGVTVELPSDGTYLVGVFAYDPGEYTLMIFVGDGTASSGDISPVSNDEPVGDVWSGHIDDDTPFNQIVLEDVPAGATITVDIQAMSGDLDAYAGVLFDDEVVFENDDRAKGDSNPLVEYRAEEAGTYTIIITRFDFEDGTTSGDFEATVYISNASKSAIINTVAFDSDGARTVVKPEGVRAFSIDGLTGKTENPLLAGVGSQDAAAQE
jgi:hypothetical protein